MGRTRFADIAAGEGVEPDIDTVLGAFEPMVAPGVQIETDALGRLRLRATADLEGFATGRFSQPAVGVMWSSDGWSPEIEFVGFAFTQFALPVVAGHALDFDFRPAPGLRSPRAMSPLLARAGDRVVLLAPIDHPHEQIIALVDGAIVWGWHGDLDTIPTGFSSTLGMYSGRSVDAVLASWRNDLTIVGRPRAATNPLSTHLSYWTDNGAAYWYRTEPDRTISDSLVDVVESLRDADVPVRAVELDSWFYPHATLRPITEIGYPAEVPPTGLERWSARLDAFPEPHGDVDPIVRLRERIDGAPLVAHARHIAPDSGYVTVPAEWWIDERAAQPRDPAFFRRWFDDAARWGVTCIEQDWMLMYWFGIRALRAVPGRAAAWQSALDEHAAATDIDLLWCMATPADMIFAAGLDRVIAVRTCDDYRFADDPALLWTWFLVVNRLANTLGIPAFKDCFFSNPDVGPGDDAIDGDRHAELEALLSALSGGPVGIGDRIGRTDREIVLRTCDADGRLRRVDAAIAATDDGLFGGPARGDGLLWATTTATDADGDVWTYVVAINTAADRHSIADRFDLDGQRTALDWRTGDDRACNLIEVELEPRDWSLHIVSPAGRPPASAAGDVAKYVVVEAAPPNERR